MFNSLLKLGWNFEIIGLGTPWKGWSTKMTAVANFAKEQNPDLLLVCVDCYDAFAVRSPAGFREAFEVFGGDLVVE